MEPWALELLSLVIGIAGGVIGAFVGVRVAVGKLEVRVSTVEKEVEMLRKEKHAHAGFLTQHELRIESLEREVRS